jgi:6-phosphogluconolactonase
MSFLRATHAARARQSCLSRTLVAAVVVLAGLSLSCNSTTTHTPTAAPGHIAYVTLPAVGSVLLLNIDGATGVITTGAQTPHVEGLTPTGLALTSSKKFLYAVNSLANTISTFNVASDGTLTLSGTPIPVDGSGPDVAIIDPSGKYLLVTNNFTNDISVFSIGSDGALSEVMGSPFYANANPTEILITPSGKFVYVTNPGIGMITAFSFSNSTGMLTELKTVGSPFSSLPGGGGGAAALAVDSSERFLYVANPTASNPLVTTVGNISGFNIDSNTGALSPILGSPFTSISGSLPSALAVDPSGRFLYAVTPGTGASIWCFTITSTNGQLLEVPSSPFGLPAGGLFARFDPSGNYFYIGSASGNGIDGYTYNSSTGLLTTITGSPFSTVTPPGKMVFSP